MRIRWSYLTLALLFAPGLSFASTGALDGTAWRIHAKGKSDTEDLIYVNGNFTSSGCVPYGFYTSPYASTKQDKTVGWTASQRNTAGEKMEWKGEASGDKIKGFYRYTDRRGKLFTEDWEGEKIQAK
jgi:hypothetical protein